MFKVCSVLALSASAYAFNMPSVTCDRRSLFAAAGASAFALAPLAANAEFPGAAGGRKADQSKIGVSGMAPKAGAMGNGNPGVRYAPKAH